MEQYKSDHCPCCNAPKRYTRFAEIKPYTYFRCKRCGSIYIDPLYLNKIDAGFNLVKYDEVYWQREIPAARERCYGANLSRMAETLYYSRIPVTCFLDIGSGTGHFLDAVSKLLPSHQEIFFGVETFPPPVEFRTKSPNYIIGGLKDIEFKVDAGICIEVIEHLTPNMLADLFRELAAVSNPQALYMFNTGMPEYVQKENPQYLNPFLFGHIVSYSTEAVNNIAAPFGFKVFPLKGKTWAFCVEYQSRFLETKRFQDRIWSALKPNLDILDDQEMGSTLKILGLETARAYG